MCASFIADGLRHLPARSMPRPVRGTRVPCALASRRAVREPLRLPQRPVELRSAHAGLGAASAGPVHAWALPMPLSLPTSASTSAPAAAATTTATPLPAGAAVIRIPLELLQAMRRTAAAEGRDEAAAWAEAAREWLAGRARDDEPQPPTPAAGALPCPRAANAWAAIDAVLADLRTPTSHHAGHAA